MNKNASKFVLIGVIASSFIGVTGYSMGINASSAVEENLSKSEDISGGVDSGENNAEDSSSSSSGNSTSSNSGSSSKSKTSSPNSKSSSSKNTSNSSSGSNSSKSVSSSKPSIPSNLKDGEYTGEAKGYKSTIKAVVKVSGGKISSIDISGGDDEPYFGNAKALVSSIISSQSTSVDSVSGATYSSNGIKNAVANALKNAGASGAKSNSKKPSSKENNNTQQKNDTENKKDNPKNSDSGEDLKNLKDGEYKGEAQGFKSKIVATVKIMGGKIVDISVDGADDKSYFDNAKKMILAMKEKNTYSVDTISGATYSSNGIKNAVKEALKKAGMTVNDNGIKELKESLEKISKEYKEGIQKLINEISNINTRMSSPNSNYSLYEGEAKGYRSTIKSKVYVDKQSKKITSISVSGSDDEPYFTDAKKIIPKIIEKQDTDVDLVSGATFSSRGIRDSVKDAMNKIKSSESNKSESDSLNKEIERLKKELDLAIKERDKSILELNKKIDELQKMLDEKNSQNSNNERKNEDSNTSNPNETLPKKATFTEYEGEAQGFKSKIKARVKVEDSTGRISDISVSGNDDEPFFDRAKKVIQSIISRQTTDVDSISGATYSSDGIKNAVADAMKKVKK